MRTTTVDMKGKIRLARRMDMKEEEYCCLCWDNKATLELTDNDGDRLIFCEDCYSKEKQHARANGTSIIEARVMTV